MTTETFDVELRPIDAIRPYEGNPRVNDAAVEAVAASLREFGSWSTSGIAILGIRLLGVEFRSR